MGKKNRGDVKMEYNVTQEDYDKMWMSEGQKSTIDIELPQSLLYKLGSEGEIKVLSKDGLLIKISTMEEKEND